MTVSLGPRLVVAGTHSGVGKTTVATGLMAALRNAGHSIRSAKVGPDFIDPGYHSVATGGPPRNLDAWICGSEVIPGLAGRAAHGADVLVVEGVMGLYDGAVDGTPSSTADLSRLIDAPVILVVDGSAMSASIAALVRGFRDHEPSVHLAGVIINRVSSERHRQLLVESLEAIDVEVFGTLPRSDDLTWRDRHLGLVPVAEQPTVVATAVDRLAAVVAEGCDLSRIVDVARLAPKRSVSVPPLPEPVVPRSTLNGPLRIAVAGGEAFTFVYRDNLEAFEAAGAELVGFDPLTDEVLPDPVHGLYLAGGFPEIFAERLGENRRLATEVSHRIAMGLPCWAECGGLLWLTRSLNGKDMLGVVDAAATMSDRLTLGYRSARVERTNPVAPAGAVLRGHEFHYSTVEPGGDALALTSRFASRSEGFAHESLFASYLHLHLGGEPSPASRFVASCYRAPSYADLH